MEDRKIAFLFPLGIFFSLFFFSFFLNFLTSLYSGINLFKLDLKKKEERKEWKKIVFILKNSNLLFAIVCFAQVLLNIVMSQIFMEEIIEKHFPEQWVKGNRWIVIILLSLSIAFFTEIFVRYLVNKPNSKKKIFNKFYIFVAFLLVRVFYFLRIIVKPKKKIFSDSEKDVIRFIENLTLENTLEIKEAALVKSALNFDEVKVCSVLTPWKNVAYFSKSMNLNEVRRVHSQRFFTRYPVLDEKNKAVGIFNIEIFYWELIKKKDGSWQDYIDKEITYFSPDESLDKVLTGLQNSNCHLAIVKKRRKFIGIVTLHDVLSALVGKIKEEREKLLLPRPLN